MNATTIVVLVLAVLVGLGIGYGTWGSRSGQLAADIAAARAQAREAGTQEGTLATRVQSLESQLKQVTETLRSEEEARVKLEALAKARAKPR